MGHRAGRSIAIDDFASHIPDGSRVYLAQGSGTPYGLLDLAVEQRSSWSELTFVSAFMLREPSPLAHLGDPFSWISLQPTGTMRSALDHDRFGACSDQTECWRDRQAAGSIWKEYCAVWVGSPPAANPRSSK